MSSRNFWYCLSLVVCISNSYSITVRNQTLQSIKMDTCYMHAMRHDMVLSLMPELTKIVKALQAVVPYVSSGDLEKSGLGADVSQSRALLEKATADVLQKNPFRGEFSLRKWFDRCLILPIYVEGGKNTETALSTAEFKTVRGHFNEYAMQSELGPKQNFIKSADGWTGEMLLKEPAARYHDGSKLFMPFVQKKIVADGTALYCCSDIHGDIHSLNAFLMSLYDQGKVQDNLVLSSDILLVFQGDYVDGGWYGMEVLYVLMQLKIKNSERVIIIRGNHEEIGMNRSKNYYSFGQELQDKFSGLSLDYVARIYDWMPVAAYIGIADDHGNYEYSLHTHAYIEIGFDPRALLSDVTGAAFAFVPIHMDRAAAFAGIQQIQPMLKTLQKPKGWGDARRETYSNKLAYLNFSHGDITLDQILITDEAGRNVRAYGKEITQGILQYWSLPKHQIKMLVRGHQHMPLQNPTNSTSTLYKDMKENNGVGLLLGEDHKALVLSLWSSPLNKFDSVGWNDPKDPNVQGKIPPIPWWPKQSYVVLAMRPDFARWLVSVFSIPVAKIDPQWESTLESWRAHVSKQQDIPQESV